jgi:chemotaxis protein MotB
MHSATYATNWELSVARASRVARFLIEEVGIPGMQVVVSGYSYFRPLRPNDNERNRKANRRVEIILSKQLPPAVPATAENLN